MINSDFKDCYFIMLQKGDIVAKGDLMGIADGLMGEVGDNLIDGKATVNEKIGVMRPVKRMSLKNLPPCALKKLAEGIEAQRKLKKLLSMANGTFIDSATIKKVING